jgi:ferrous iron transport protein B
MNTSVIHIHPAGALVALVGNPNCGKTALFNLLTGSRQKVANYAGVTVERKEGRLLAAPGSTPARVLDLPGAYSLYPRSPDERVTADVLAGRAVGEKRPDLVVCVVDATNLRRNLRLVLAVMRQGLPVVVALNMADLAARRGLPVDAQRLSQQLGVPVVPTVGVQQGGDRALRELIADKARWPAPPSAQADASHDDARLQTLLQTLGLTALQPDTATERIDRIALHPVAGPLLLAALLFFVFQAVFAWARAPMEAIQAATQMLSEAVKTAAPAAGAGHWLGSLVADGLMAGVGGVLVFLPQILILFFFIIVLEESGYLPRAAFLLDRLMGGVGLSGRSFIPLLSSFACAIPGIMATRTISDPRDRLVTMLIAPLMTCSARLPVYTLLIGAFVPAREVGGGLGLGLGLQGLALFVLYVAGIVAAFCVAWVLKLLTTRGEVRMLMMELPSYHWPAPRHVALGLVQRARIFLRRVGGVILALTLALWFLASFPGPPPGATGAPIEYSVAGMLGKLLAHVFEPIGFNWQISVALVPGMAAREVVVSSLATVYALGAEDMAGALAPVIAKGWSAATAYSLLAWFVFAPQCLSTLAAVRRETGGWKIPAVLVGYLFALAYGAAFGTYRVALALGA